MNLLHLYRPRVPDLRAQAIQVLHTCHALARRGHRVTLFVERAPDLPADPALALAPYGLAPHPDLDLRFLPRAHPGVAGFLFRWGWLRWLRDRNAEGDEVPVVYARTMRHARDLLRLRALARFHLVFEAHEVDSAQAAEAGDDPAPHRRREAAVFAAAAGLVTNCEGTLEVLEEVHGAGLPPRRAAIHNGTDPSRVREPVPHGGILAGYAGSLRATKDMEALVGAAALLPDGFRIRIVGGTPGELEYEGVARAAGPRVTLSPAVPYTVVPDVLAALDVLVLSLGEDLYARRLASPLKLWDYLATGRPVVAPDHPSVRAVCGPGGFTPYRPGDAASLARAIEVAATSPARPRRLRSWDDRARDLEAFLGSLP